MKIVYQAYGKEEIFEQAYFSLHSLFQNLSPKSETSVLVYTDHPDYFSDFKSRVGDRLTTRPVSSEELFQWAGPKNFVHRVKLEILRDASRTLKESLLYCDGDTIFLEDPSSLSAKMTPTTSLMHVQEYRLGKPKDPLAKKLRKFAKKNVITVAGQAVRITDDFQMWNAGVIGLHPSGFSKVDQMILLSDALYDLYPKHVMEQLAVSHVLQTTGEILSSDKHIYHYWDQKPEYLEMFKVLRAQHQNFDQMALAVSKLKWPKRQSKKASFFSRFLGH